MTQTELAKILGVGMVSVSRWESGKHEPTMNIKRKLKSLFLEAGMKVNRGKKLWQLKKKKSKNH